MEAKQKVGVIAFNNQIIKESWGRFTTNLISLVMATALPNLLMMAAAFVGALGLAGASTIREILLRPESKIEIDAAAFAIENWALFLTGIAIAIVAIYASYVAMAGIIAKSTEEKDASYGVKEIFTTGKPFIWKLFVANLIVFFLAVASFVVVGGLLAAFGELAIIGVIVLLVVGIRISFALMVLNPIIILEKHSAMDAINRSYNITKQKLLYLIIFLLALSILSIPSLFPVVGFVASLILSPLYILMLGRLYVNLNRLDI